jgi:lipopolysaccharide transport system permease protein
MAHQAVPSGSASRTAPLVVIEPARGWAPLALGELWQFRDLLGYLTARELQVRYAQTMLGAGWVVFKPLSTMLVLWVFFARFAGVSTNGMPAPLFYFAGLTLWFLFVQIVTDAKDSVVQNAPLVTKVSFPRLLLPLAITTSRLIDFLVTFALLIVLTAYYRGVPDVTFLATALPVVVVTGLATGLGIAAAAATARFRDAGHLVPALSQLLLFASPIIYPTSLVPVRWRDLYAWNPLVGCFEAFRAAVAGQPIVWDALLRAAGVSGVVLLVSLYVFRMQEDTFADVV